MATDKELIFSKKKFMFRGKKYKFHSYVFKPAIVMVSDDGELFPFGICSPIAKEFILLDEESK